MSKRPKRLTRRERRAPDDPNAAHIFVFDDPPVAFAGSIAEYIDALYERLDTRWDELLAALRNEYQAGRLAFHQTPEGLIFGLEINSRHIASYRGFNEGGIPCREAA
jgi:hypothetical protein